MLQVMGSERLAATEVMQIVDIGRCIAKVGCAILIAFCLLSCLKFEFFEHGTLRTRHAFVKGLNSQLYDESWQA